MSAEEWPEVTVPKILGTEPAPTVPPGTVDVEQVRARWRVDRMRYRRKVSRALDEHLIRMYGAEHAAEYGIRGRWAA